MLMRNTKSNKRTGVTRCSQTSAARANETTEVAISAAIKSLRLSTMSASAPAGSTNKNRGRLLATSTSDTNRGSGFRIVISYAAAAPNIHQPTSATTVTDQSTANTRFRNGLQNDSRAAMIRISASPKTLRAHACRYGATSKHVKL
jgi:hypothetical protein